MCWCVYVPGVGAWYVCLMYVPGVCVCLVCLCVSVCVNGGGIVGVGMGRCVSVCAHVCGMVCVCA